MIPASLFAWIASFLYGGEVITGKLTAKYAIDDPYLFNFVLYLFQLMITFPIALWFGARMPADWVVMLLAALFLALGNTLYTLALYRLDVSVISPLYNFRVAIGTLIAALLLGEILTFPQYLLVAAMFVGGMFVSFEERYSVRSFFNRGTIYALLSMVAFSLMAVYIKIAVAESGLWTTTLWTGILAQVMLLASIPLFKTKTCSLKRKQYAAIGVVALIGIVATFAANAAYAINVSIATAIIAVPFGMVATIALSTFMPHLLESHSRKVYGVRLVAAAVMFVAALGLS